MAGTSRWSLGATSDIKTSDFLFGKHKMPPTSTKLSPPPGGALKKLAELAKTKIDKNKNEGNVNNKSRQNLATKSRAAMSKNKTTLKSLTTGEFLISTGVSKMTKVNEDNNQRDKENTELKSISTGEPKGPL